MCQACLALASQRSEAPDQDRGAWLTQRRPSRFSAAADWADEATTDQPSETAAGSAPQASGGA
jgi:hypothetical protein